MMLAAFIFAATLRYESILTKYDGPVFEAGDVQRRRARKVHRLPRSRECVHVAQRALRRHHALVVDQRDGRDLVSE